MVDDAGYAPAATTCDVDGNAFTERPQDHLPDGTEGGCRSHKDKFWRLVRTPVPSVQKSGKDKHGVQGFRLACGL